MFFIFLFVLTTFLFKNAFTTYFINDDFFFLKISRVNNLSEFINFFNPTKNYFYRPLSTEIFYSLIHLLKENIYISHLIVFIVFFIGLYFLYKVINLLFKDKLISYLFVGFYAINFIHVFQLYFFGTFQEIACFTFIIISFYSFLKKKHFISILFYILALLSKESALFYLPFLFLFSIYSKRLNKKIIFFLVISIFFLYIFKSGLSNTSIIDSYRFQPNLKLALNNSLWYFLWGLGVPNFTSLYFTSIFSPPIPDFWKMLINFPEIKTYYFLLALYYSIMLLGIFIYILKNQLKKIKIIFSDLFIGLFGFFIFLGPVIFIEHRWMVRLTMPLIFSILIQLSLIVLLLRSNIFLRFFGIVLIIIYFWLQALGIPIHESSSTFLLESRFTKNALRIFEKNKAEIIKHKYIYFTDKTDINPMPWGGSKKLKVTLSDQNFINHYFSSNKIKAIYEFENKKIPNNSFIINSFDILLLK